MASEKTNTTINALASEVMDLWQEHLSLYAAGPQARTELAKMLEPQRQLFADWSAMMQNGLHGAGATQTTESASGKEARAGAEAGAAPVSSASDDGALRLAQLAYRMAELEKRMAKLESANAAPAKTPRGRKTH